MTGYPFITRYTRYSQKMVQIGCPFLHAEKSEETDIEVQSGVVWFYLSALR